MKILVIGDIIRDKYIYGYTERLNPESSAVPLIRQSMEETKLGGAALVWDNLTNLGVDCDIIEYDKRYQDVKTRIISDGHYVCRVDSGFGQIAGHIAGEEVFNKVKAIDFSQYSYCILSDYDKGALAYSNDIIKMANAAGCKVVVDPKGPADRYTGAWLIKANKKESIDFDYNDMLSSTKHNIIITDADDPFHSVIDGERYHTYVDPVEVADVTGAGDCFLAAFVYGLTKGYSHRKCLDIAVRGATTSVQHQGTYILEPEDVEHTVVFTNGCFDILHRGHIEYLEQSKKLGNKLIVGLNSDASVKRLKGDSRPINNEQDRRMALEALRCVDEVHIFHEATPYDLIKTIGPDIITKGGDYKPEDVVGNDLADVVILPYVENYSTTNIVRKLND
jgi:D-beta-D-heptose 7-phosphate kinase/D-beta-D-heptose 1-phosphate adenosyltransferase